MNGDSVGGRLLVAAPSLRGGIFERSVVFVLHHDSEGAVGLVLNRPGETRVASALPSWAELATPPQVVFAGGPVATSQLLGLARRSGASPGSLEVIATLSLDAEPEPGQASAIRLFAGYAGWAPGQLEGEIEVGGWFVVPAAADDPFSASPEQLWRSVLRRQSGALALLATFPEDPSLN